MKTNRKHTLLTTTLAVLLGGLLLRHGAQAAIIGINASGSYAQIIFNDTTSSSPAPGAIYPTPFVTPWAGLPPVLLPTTTDPVTMDSATGDIAASVLGPTVYDVSLNGIALSQAPANTGFAVLQYSFSIEFQTDINGLTSQPTLYPNFLVNGTIQPGGFASVMGTIDYRSNPGTTSFVLETVTYNSLWTNPTAVPISFSAIAMGMSTPSGTTGTVIGNDVLVLDGNITFTVDPATINVQSVPAPEPTAGVLALLSSLPMLLRRRRAIRA